MPSLLQTRSAFPDLVCSAISDARIALLDQSPIVTIISGAAFVIGVAGILIYLRVVNRLDGVPTKMVDCHSRGDAAMSYIVTYIVPFLAFVFSEWQQAAALVVFFVIPGFLYVNSDMIHINPTLNFFMYRLYEVTLDACSSMYSLIARSRVQKGGSLRHDSHRR